MKIIKTIIFIIWLMTITVSSIIPHGKDDVSLSLKLTNSGMVMHFIAYFVAAVLFYWAYRKDTLFSILFSSFIILLYSVALEIVQVFLPYRAFNPVDIAANASGIAFFNLVWTVFWRRRPGMEIGDNLLERGNRSADYADSTD